MGRLVFWIFIGAILIVVVGMIYLSMAEIPAPVSHVEKVLPNAPAAP